MHIGNRVNALDWDNVGTIERLHDHPGHATVRFTTSDGHTPTPRPSPGNNSNRSTTPNPPSSPTSPNDTSPNSPTALDHDLTAWNSALNDHGIDPHEPTH